MLNFTLSPKITTMKQKQSEKKNINLEKIISGGGHSLVGFYCYTFFKLFQLICLVNQIKSHFYHFFKKQI